MTFSRTHGIRCQRQAFAAPPPPDHRGARLCSPPLFWAPGSASHLKLKALMPGWLMQG